MSPSRLWNWLMSLRRSLTSRSDSAYISGSLFSKCFLPLSISGGKNLSIIFSIYYLQHHTKLKPKNQSV